MEGFLYSFILSTLASHLHITYANGWKSRTSDIETQKPEGGSPPVFASKWNRIFVFFLLIQV